MAIGVFVGVCVGGVVAVAIVVGVAVGGTVAVGGSVAVGSKVGVNDGSGVVVAVGVNVGSFVGVTNWSGVEGKVALAVGVPAVVVGTAVNVLGRSVVETAVPVGVAVITTGNVGGIVSIPFSGAKKSNIAPIQ